MELCGWTIPLWLVLIVLVIVTYLMYMTWEFGVFRKMGVPGPRPLPIMGNFLEIDKLGFAKADLMWVKQYGKVFGTFNGRTPNLVTMDENMLREIFVKQFNNFCDRQNFEGMNGEMEDALITITGNHWRNVRHLLSPTFSTGKLKRMTPLILKTANSLVDQMAEEMKKDKQLDMKRFYGGFTLDTIASTAFGIEVNSIKNPDDPFLKNVKKLLDFGNFSPAVVVVMFFPFLIKYAGKLGISFSSREAEKFFRKKVVDAINERTTERTDYVDFLQLMMKAHLEGDDNNPEERKGMTFSEIMGNCLLFFFAGYETTSSLLSLLSYEVARHPDIQDKIHNEVVDLIGDGEPTYENVQKLTYLEMCINETLRMYPPATRTDRVCVQDTTIEGLRIPKGMVVNAPIYAIHHSAEYWEDPEKFDPERFSPENKTRHTQFQFMPFGYGPRNCIGMRLALVEAKIALAKVFRRFRLSHGDKTEVPDKIEQLGLLSPKELWLNVHVRE